MEPYIFPSASLADDKTGLLGIGANWHPETLLDAYQKGIFPWPHPDFDEIPWFSPAKRAILKLSDLSLNKRAVRKLKNSEFKYTANNAFLSVITACSEIKRKPVGKNQNSSWISHDMILAYLELHKLGQAHSIEVWHEEKLAGGIYGVLANNIFSAESMFKQKSEASKAAFFALCQVLSELQLKYLDCQIISPHLSSWGVKEVPRENFIEILEPLRIDTKFPNGNIAIKF